VNLLFVNPIHPDTPHISGTRAWRFAQALAARGHRVVLLTGTAPGAESAPVARPADHDWRRPLVVAVAPFDTTARSAGGPRFLEKLATAWRLLRHGGRQRAWVDAALPAARELSPGFRPDAVWTTFGRMEAVVAARRIARALRVPWVLDLKDNWELFVPGPLRWIMARRIRGWHAMTTNAKAHGAFARRWHGSDAHVIYSGVDEAFLGTGVGSPPGEDGRFVLNLVGSLYFEGRLAGLLGGIAAWAATLPPRDRAQVLLRYLGGDVEMFERGVAAAGLALDSEACGYVPVASMAAACRRAAINLYIAHDHSFHHKLLELLACGRPVLCVPSEGDEARHLAGDLRGELIDAADAPGIMEALQAVHRRWSAGDRQPAPAADLYRRLSWESQASLLEGVLADATRH
jgi:glycosyltransferase involved in cell wall biosynthesis